MAGSDDETSKTEEPSDRKVDEARKKGNEPFSQEVNLAFSLVAIFIISTTIGGKAFEQLSFGLSEMLASSEKWPLEATGDAISVTKGAATIILLFLSPLVALMTVAGIMAAVIQNPVAMKVTRIAPDFSRIAPSSGFSRLFSFKGLVNFGKVVAKMGVIAFVSYGVLKRSGGGIQKLQFMDPSLLPRHVQAFVNDLLISILVPVIAIAVADTWWTRQSWQKSLRMTRQELKDEHKQAGADPAVKARVAAVARQRSRRRMLSAVPTATLVVVNPTHYSVALRYQRSEGGAPTVVARGVDEIALKIRRLAAQHDIPVIEDVGLARALYENTRLDQAIPPEFYVAIAKLLTILYSAKSSAAKPIKG